eukprot:CAMPEP_0168627156 /NCGR_PEP_ID=MMETSP0449_2-20121227/11066_1 /TAXON_ID=1082188 /ORGANISM="Strombidium rassoulzadegani, Strain ras09" /LENGTH=71 /DNA_ID=CAMNT_0008669301 /DNA_START=154 /DNA_END=368 /DNA_ORIENTATION=+
MIRALTPAMARRATRGPRRSEWVAQTNPTNTDGAAVEPDAERRSSNFQQAVLNLNQQSQSEYESNLESREQ